MTQQDQHIKQEGFDDSEHQTHRKVVNVALNEQYNAAKTNSTLENIRYQPAARYARINT